MRMLSLSRVKPSPIDAFGGSWTLESQDGHEALLEAMELPWYLRKAASSARSPDVTIEKDEDGLLHSHAGPVFGRYIHEVFKEGGSDRQRAPSGAMTTISYAWDGNVLTSTVTTDDQPDRSHNRRWVVDAAAQGGGGPKRMVVTNDFTKRAEAASVRYTRVYVPLPAS